MNFALAAIDAKTTRVRFRAIL